MDAANNHLMASMNMQKEWPPPTRKAKADEEKKRKKKKCCLYLGTHSNAELVKKNVQILKHFQSFFYFLG